MGKKVLFVDDEVQILKSLTRLFIDTDYEIFTAESGIEALEALTRNEIDLIISDMRMPEMDGYQLLCEVKKKYPSVLRVILSGYSDEKTVFKSLQQNIAKLYIFKPWENEKLLKIVNQIFETEELLKDSNLLLLVNNTEGLPTIKTNYQRIINYIENDGEMSQIARLIELDQSIATKILQVANSAYYGVKTGSIKQAVTYLGLLNIKNLVVSTSIIDTFEEKGSLSKNIDYLWKHSFATNKIVNFIYEGMLNKKLPEISMTAGLLHNIGKVFLLKFFPVKFQEAYKISQKDKVDIIEVEKRIFNVTHQHAGAYLLKWWELPLPIVESALYHHTPFDESIIEKELVCAVHIAQKYAWDLLHHVNISYFDINTFNSLGFNREKFEGKLKDIKID